MSVAIHQGIRKKRLVFRILIHLFIGFAVTIGIAWVGIITSDLAIPNEVAGEILQSDGSTGLARGHQTTLAERCVLLHDRDPKGAFVNARFSDTLAQWWIGKKTTPQELIAYQRRASWTQAQVQYAMPPIAAVRANPSLMEMPASTTPPSWLEPTTGHDNETGAYWSLQVDDRAGWPFRSLGSRLLMAPITTSNPHHAERCEGGIPLLEPVRLWNEHATGTTAFVKLEDWKALPIRPIWPGFIFNVLFWSVAPLACWWTVQLIVRLWRSFKGRCRRCGYDLRGIESLKCPECGVAVDKSKRAQRSPQSRR